MTMLRGLLEAAMARGVAIGGTDTPPVAVRRGYSYVCSRCDVYGYLGPDDAVSCWSCDQDDAIDRR